MKKAATVLVVLVAVLILAARRIRARRNHRARGQHQLARHFRRIRHGDCRRRLRLRTIENRSLPPAKAWREIPEQPTPSADP